MPTEPFGAEEVIRIAESFKRDPIFADRHEVITNWRNLRWRQAGVDIRGIAEKLEYRTPAIASNVDHYRNPLRAAKIRISVVARDQTQPAIAAAQRGENFFYDFYHDLRRRYGEADDRAIDLQVSDGIGPLHLPLAADVRERLFGKERLVDDLTALLHQVFGEGFEGNPFALRCPDPLSLYWDTDLSSVCEVGPVRVSTLLAAYPELEGHPSFADIVSETMSVEAGLNVSDRTIDFYSLETAEYCYEAIQLKDRSGARGEAIELRRHPNVAHRPRYTFAAGHLTAGEQAWQRYRPLVHDLYPEAQIVNITGTLLNTGALVTGRMMWQEVETGRQAQDFLTYHSLPAEERNVVSFDPSSDKPVRQPRKGYHWEVMPLPDMSILLQAHQEAQARMLAFGYPLALSPSAVASAESGYDRVKQQEPAQQALEPPLANRARAWRELFLLAADQLKEIDLPVTIPVIQRATGESADVRQMVTIKPDDFQDIYLEVAFESISATAQWAQQESDRRDVELGYMSKSSYMAKLYEDPKREMKQVDLDRVAEESVEAVIQMAKAYLKAQGPQMVQEVATEMGVPTGVQPEGDGFKPARPAGGPMPNVGMPAVPPEQAQTGGGAPPGVDSGATGVAQ